MNRYSLFASVAVALALVGVQVRAARAECKQQITASIPISFVNNQPMVEATIDGKPANLRFSLSTETYLWGTALKDYGLKEVVNNSIAHLSGIGGSADATATLVHELKMGDVVQKDGHYFMIYAIKKDGEAGVFGSNAFGGQADIEIDFPHNIVRAVKASGCKDAEVLYWGGSYSVIERAKSGFYPMAVAGRVLDGYFEPGNEVTFVSIAGARHAGVTLQAAGPLPMSMIAGGAVKPVEVSIANFPELVVGDETIKNAPLAVGDVWPNWRNDFLPELILGADFFRSHRVYISRQQRKVYFSYVGKPPFEDIYARLGIQAPPTLRQPPKP